MYLLADIPNLQIGISVVLLTREALVSAAGHITIGAVFWFMQFIIYDKVMSRWFDLRFLNTSHNNNSQRFSKIA